jgi:hypothetical protein
MPHPQADQEVRRGIAIGSEAFAERGRRKQRVAERHDGAGRGHDDQAQ